VSRPTVRTALQLLARDGVVEIHHGRRNRLLRSSARRATAQSRLVGIVTQEPLSQMTQNAYQGVAELRAHLAEQGFATEIIVCPSGGGRARLRKLDTFISDNAVFCCVLITVSEDVQRWFAARRVPALVVGSCHDAVALPSLDIDFRSVCRHAAGEFLRRGHRSIAFVVQDSGFAGDLASEAGFREGAEQHGPSDSARAVIVRHNGTARHITAKLDTVFESANPPTALLVARPWAVFAVIIYLLKRGQRVPDAVSLLARDQDDLFQAVDPPIAHYRLEPGAFVHRLSRLMLDLVQRRHLASEPHLLFPKLAPGGTLK
jgi:LacI family transcriptional regulator